MSESANRETEMTAKTIRLAVEHTYGQDCMVEGITEVFCPEFGWCDIGRAYRSFGSLCMGLLSLGRWSQVNIKLTDRWGVTHRADFSRAELN
jgi:hypothetical protein